MSIRRSSEEENSFIAVVTMLSNPCGGNLLMKPVKGSVPPRVSVFPPAVCSSFVLPDCGSPRRTN